MWETGGKEGGRGDWEVPVCEECVCPVNAHMLVQTFSLLNQVVPIALFLQDLQHYPFTGGISRTVGDCSKEIWKHEVLLHDYLLLEKSDVKQNKTTPTTPPTNSSYWLLLTWAVLRFLCVNQALILHNYLRINRVRNCKCFWAVCPRGWSQDWAVC